MIPDSDANKFFSTLLNDSIASTLFQLVIHLGHYSYAMAQLREEALLQVPRLAMISFYTDNVLRMIGDWFSEVRGTREAQLDNALKKVGMEDTVTDPLDHLLDSTIGTTTWRRLIKDYRNFSIGHRIFEGDVQRQVCEMHGVEPTLMSSQLRPFLDGMADQIEILQSYVELAFHRYDPELYTLLLRGGVFRSTGIEPAC